MKHKKLMFYILLFHLFTISPLESEVKSYTEHTRLRIDTEVDTIRLV